MSRMRWCASVVGLVLVVSVAGCGASSVTQRTQPTVNATLAATPAPIPLPTVDPTQVAHACGTYAPYSAVQVGGLAVAPHTSFGNLAYPGAQLPDGLPLAPYSTGQGPSGAGQPLDAVPTNPTLHERGGGYVIAICNASSVSHTIDRIDARMERMTPYTGQLNVLPGCTSTYSRPNGAVHAACGGGDGQSVFLHAPFQSSAGPGTTVTAQQLYVNPDGPATPGGMTLPLTLQPGQVVTIEVGMGDMTATADHPLFATPGTYTFSFGIGVDGASPIFAATSPATLLAPVAHTWSGQACAAAAMQAQIPAATTPPTYYICPDA